MELLKVLGIDTQKEELYMTALTHTSYANEHNVISYERLEYLGDAVLELIISEYLYKTCSKGEGVMTKLRSQYVCENALYEYSLRLKLNDFLLLGHGEAEHGGKFRKTIVADIFESFIGAMYLDKGFSYVKKFIFRHIIPNSLAPIIVQATMGIGSAVLSTSSLSYLGIGVEPHIPEWGNVLKAGSTFLETNPYIAIYPGLAIIIIVLAFNFFGDGLRDALDPKLK